MPLQAGQVFAGYTILRLLGAGGMGSVYLVAHPRLPREDALKVLPTELTNDPEYHGRFLQEADLAATLSHPHIVSIHDRGEDEGQFWISMEYVSGTDASRLLAQSYPAGMPLEMVAPIITGVGSALDYAHHRGLLHRDVKPANVLLTEPDGQARRVFLTDFGIARRIDDAAGLTKTNMTVGTVFYAAPEQLSGLPIGGQADQYALACTAFHLLTGAPPFADTNQAVVIDKHVNAPPPSIGAGRPELAALDLVFAIAMAKNPSERFGSCQEFADQLGERLKTDPMSAHQAPLISYPSQTQLALRTAVPPAPVERRRRPHVRTAALAAAVLLLIAGGVFAAVRLTGHHHPGGESTTVANAPNTGPFTGVYRAKFGVGTGLDGVGGGFAPVTNTYAVRSACGAGGCIATASLISGDLKLAPTMVFDQVGGGTWVAVAVDSDICENRPDELWDVLSLQPHPDGALTGDFRLASANFCNVKRTVTFTRTGDVDVNSLPDPASLPARVVSPAEALHGHYHLRRVFNRVIPEQEEDDAVTTDCLRTAERCMSYFHSPTSDSPLVFADRNWTMDVTRKQNLETCGLVDVSASARYPLPPAHQDPIMVLNGSGQLKQGDCGLASFSETITRTGD